MRLNKYIARSGYCSRRSADNLIFNKKVKVNNQIVENPGYRVDIESDIVCVENQPLSISKECLYYMLNKPIGYMSSLKDPNYDKFVIDLIPENERIYPIGRLDVDSQGLLLLTNDGDLTYKLTHPKHDIKKVYYVELDKILSHNEINVFKQGVYIDEEYLVKGDVFGIDSNTCYIAIKEGKNRQIRKMFATIGYKVTLLKRISIGNLSLGNLEPGSFRLLTDNEIEYLKNL